MTNTANGDGKPTVAFLGLGIMSASVALGAHSVELHTGAWCDVVIPLSAFKAANPALDLSLIKTRFSISDVWSATGNVARSGMPPIKLDNIYWSH